MRERAVGDGYANQVFASIGETFAERAGHFACATKPDTDNTITISKTVSELKLGVRRPLPTHITRLIVIMRSSNSK